MTRREANLQILEKLTTVAEYHSQLRFHQLLWYVGIENGDDGFYEESVETLERMEKNEPYCLTLDEIHKLNTI